ncbi:MAG TPA: class I SAM-dependent rRNA methyltransferase [Terriglobales bacterium]|nr:class I SAM-dependent rRNA methyltransferase [Terriglobales bacterium]
MPAKLSSLENPKVRVSQRGAQRLKAGHVWVYRSDVVSAAGIAPGSLVDVVDERGRSLGTAFYSSASQIAIRWISRDPVREPEDLLRKRIRDAIAYRERVVKDTNAYRVVFSEADFLPGLIVDRYRDLLAVEILTQAMDPESMRAAIVSELGDALEPTAILERSEPKIRELEQLQPRPSGLLLGEKTSTVFAMNGIQFHYDGLAGQKTGAFLDQRENYAAAAQYARGDALDVFCYQGGFALHLARSGAKVTGVDSSRPALEIADRNAELNGCSIEWIEGNAFDLLRDYSAAAHKYDSIVLDPPAFARSRSTLETALRGYKELNLRAIKMLRPGGILITCSCSYHVSEADFLRVVSEAAQDNRRSLRILESRTQARDHPILCGVPETAYLKCLILFVS